MRRVLLAFTMLTIGLFTSVAGFSNPRDGTIEKMESLYEMKGGETAKAAAVSAAVVNAGELSVIDRASVVKITGDFSLSKVKKYDGVLTSAPAIPETISLEIPYGTYLLKKYATILNTSKTRFRRDKTTLTTTSHAWNGPVTIRMLLC